MTDERRKIDAPRDDLIRGITEVKGDGNTMVGYPIVFNTWTTIDSWEGKFRERVHPGAVTKTIKERKGLVKVQFDHGMHPVIGSLPLGRPEVLRADDLGLWTETPLSQATDVQGLIKPRLEDGSIDGMSFRFSVVREEWDNEDEDLPERTILELRLFEFGPVTWPAYEATQVGIRGQAAFAAWMQQTPEERAQVMTQFGHDLRREVIRVRSGAVVIDATETRDTATDDAPADEGHSSEETREPAAGHSEEREQDAPADEGHPSPDDNDHPTAAIRRAERPKRDFSAELGALLGRERGREKEVQADA